MKKIGIITYHFAKNYGAVLQCYALQSYLSQQGYDVEVFNFISEQQRKNNDVFKHGKNIKSIIANICLFPLMGFIKKKHVRYEKFCQEYLYLTTHFTSTEDLEKYINENHFDFIISGSDQVLNPNISDFDIAFLYPFETQAKKLTYAASTGNASSTDIQGLKKYLEVFSKISIREQKDLSKFNSEMANNISIVCDPVMLLDAKSWGKMITKSSQRPYLVCYFLHKNLFGKEFQVSQKIARELGLEFKVINARFGKKSFTKGTIFDAGPKEFVDFIADSSYVCTDSFHGTLFSLIFHKRFTCFDTRNNKKDTRKYGLLESVGAVSAYQNVEDIFKICPMLDYNIIDDKINQMRKNATKYLGILNER